MRAEGINYERRGSGEPLVLLHGIGHRWQAWQPVLDRLAAERDVIAVDLPGFGESPWPGGRNAGLDNVVAALRAFFDALGLQRPHVAGNSLGGMLSLELANRSAVRSATALAPAGFWTRPAQLQALALLAAVRASGRLPVRMLDAVGRSPRARAAFAGLLFARPAGLDWAAAMADLAAMRTAKGFYPVAWAGRRYRYRGLPQVPVTIVWGDRDRILPTRQAALARRMLPDAHHVMLPRCGHVPMHDDPQRVAEVILAGSSEPTGQDG